MFSQSHIIKLTVSLYKVSDLFPEKEPLKILIRKKADEILAGLILKDKDLDKHIEVMKAYIELAENQNWAKKENFEILKREYSLLENNLKLPKKEETKEKPAFAPVELQRVEEEINLGPRHKKIIDILKKGKPIQVKDLKEAFPDVSKRTLRRDFEYLVERKIVDRVGDNNSTEYRLKSR